MVSPSLRRTRTVFRSASAVGPPAVAMDSSTVVRPCSLYSPAPRPVEPDLARAPSSRTVRLLCCVTATLTRGRLRNFSSWAVRRSSSSAAVSPEAVRFSASPKVIRPFGRTRTSCRVAVSPSQRVISSRSPGPILYSGTPLTTLNTSFSTGPPRSAATGTTAAVRRAVASGAAGEPGRETSARTPSPKLAAAISGRPSAFQSAAARP